MYAVVVTATGVSAPEYRQPAVVELPILGHRRQTSTLRPPGWPRVTPQFLVGEWVAWSQTTPGGLLESAAGMGFERSSRAGCVVAPGQGKGHLQGRQRGWGWRVGGFSASWPKPP